MILFGALLISSDGACDSDQSNAKSVCGLTEKVHNRDAAAFLAFFLPSLFFRFLPSALYICSRSTGVRLNITASIRLPLSVIHCIIDERNNSFK